MKYSIQSETLTNIADAIRAKNGETERYTPAQMAQKIIDLPSGSPVSAKPKDVNFFDYEGTLLYSYTLDEVQSLTDLPPAPKHSGLVFQEWNWSLSDIKALTRPMNIGATYITDDGKTRLHIRIWDIARPYVSLKLWQTVANGVNFDWGDGSPTETVAGTDTVNISHTYTDTGDYVISLTVSDGCNVALGPTNNPGTVMAVGYQCLKGVYIGNNVIGIPSYAFRNNHALSEISIPRSASSITADAFLNCSSLKHITFPSGTPYFGGANSSSSLTSVAIPNGISSVSGFGNDYALASITIPDGITEIVSSAFQECSTLASIIIPASVTKIGAYAFASCYNMAEYHLLPVTPPTLANKNAFNGINSGCIIYVPKGRLGSYKTATNWAAYANYMREEEMA